MRSMLLRHRLEPRWYEWPLLPLAVLLIGIVVCIASGWASWDYGRMYASKPRQRPH